MRKFFALALTLATSFSTVSAAPKAPKADRAPKAKPADKADDTFMVACINERTGPDGGISVAEAYRVCRTEIRHRAKIENAKARVAKAILACEQIVTDTCVEACDDTVKGCDCTEDTLGAAFRACRVE